MNSQYLRFLNCSVLAQLFVTAFIYLISFSPVAAEDSSSQPLVEQQFPENYSELQVDTIMAGIDDSQVRQMVINELKKDAKQQDVPEAQNSGRLGEKLAKYLGSMGNESDEAGDRLVELRNFLPYFLPNIAAIFVKAVPQSLSMSVIQYIFSILAIIAAGLILEFFFDRRVAKKHFSLHMLELPEMGGRQNSFPVL